MRYLLSALLAVATTTPLLAQGGFRTIDEPPAEDPAALEEMMTIPRGTRVPLMLLNSISTKHAAPGDLVYLESVYPVVVDGRVAIPPGTYISGSVTQAKRPGKVKGKGELYLRFEQMILPNGVIRDLIGRVGSLDGRSPESFDREEGKIGSEGGAGRDARTVGESTAAGASIGVIAGAASGSTGMGLGIGSAAGAAAGLAGVLLTRGPEAILERGSQIDMVLDRDLDFTEDELTFDNALRHPGGSPNAGPGPDPNRNRQGNGGIRGRRFPL